MTSKHTGNANELGTYALPGSYRFGVCIICGGTDFTHRQASKQTNKHIHSHADTHIY